MLAYALPFTLAFFACLCLTPPVRSAARWAGVIDAPDGRRKRHSGSIPRLGGVAVFVSFYACVWLISGRAEWPMVEEASQLASAMFFPSLVILILGIADDIWSVNPWIKIAVQLAAGLLIYLPFGYSHREPDEPIRGAFCSRSPEPPRDARLDRPRDERLQHRGRYGRPGDWCGVHRARLHVSRLNADGKYGPRVHGGASRRGSAGFSQVQLQSRVHLPGR